MNSQEIESETITCKNCGNHYRGLFCNECGQKNITERNTVKHFLEIAFNSFDLNRGVIFTAVSLFKNPGKLINDYISGKTKPYYNPLSYLLIIASIYALLMIGFNIFDTSFEEMSEILGHDEKQTQFQSEINVYIKKYLSFISVLILPFYSLLSRWVLKKFKLNYAEHLVLNTYFIAQYLLIFTLLILVFVLFPSIIKFAMPMGLIVFVAYFTYGIKSVFNTSIIRSLLSTLATFVGGMTLFYIFLLIVTILVLIVMMLAGVDIKSLVQQ